MLLSSDDKVLVEMTVTDGVSGTTDLKMFFKRRLEDNSLESRHETCRFQTDNTWIRWYIETKHVDETVVNHDGGTHHHQTWQSTVVAGDCTIRRHGHLLSRTRLRAHKGRLAESFHNIANLTREACHQHCDK